MQRLKTRPQFQAALAGGTVSRTPHFALHRAALDVAPPTRDELPSGPGSRRSAALFGISDVWLGALVPKRWARRAVTRNSIRRQVYAVAADWAPRLPPAAHVVRLRASFDRSQFVSATSEPLRRAVRAELQQLFERASRAPSAAAVGATT